jgi:hypothetical protein
VTATVEGQISTVTVPPSSFQELRALSQDDARHSIAKILVIAYIGMLTINVMGPLILFAVARPATALTVDDFKNLVLTLGTVTTGLSGILGFVMGYYFKAELDKGPTGKAKKGTVRQPN